MTGNNLFDRSAFLWGLAEELDPPPYPWRLARERYQDLGAWLRQHAAVTAGRDVQVYPQGSANLGTTNRDPFTGQFDIDLVIRVAYGKLELTQKQLNQLVNGWLGSYVWARQQAGHRLAPTKLEKGKRAWTLHYADGFHLDVLPVVPDLAGEL
ncbi:MAG TPA: nucleotidyltransferase, partial [Actinomycetes bacterium]|nr:nucleotidyltransferase [Actinomycetes bacterium]